MNKCVCDLDCSVCVDITFIFPLMQECQSTHNNFFLYAFLYEYLNRRIIGYIFLFHEYMKSVSVNSALFIPKGPTWGSIPNISNSQIHKISVAV